MEYSFDIDLAKKYGVNEAIMLKNLIFWIRKNEVNGKHFYDGKYWTYNTIKAFSLLFEFWTEKQIRGILDRLQKKGVIQTGNYNKKGYDRTLWYSVNQDVVKGETICPQGQMEKPSRANGKAQEGEPIPDNKPDINKNTDNKPNDSIESLSFFCPYCFKKNNIWIQQNEYWIVKCSCGKIRLSSKTPDSFCESMNKNYKYYALAELLYEEHLKSDDKFLAGKDLVQTFLRWANDIRLLCETDKRERELVEKVIVWCQQHEGNNGFSWKNNILSGKKLREKFPVLYGQYMQQARTTRIINYLNDRLSFDKSHFSNFTMGDLPKFDLTDDTLKYPEAILKRGKSHADCIRVIDVMVSHWKFDPKMREYLRPSTLFNSEKFEGYLKKPIKPKWETLDDGATWQWEEE